ncbi:hypothetical protein EW145_g5753 [Phellinidium pouzarii]|uniref:Uncharacterized protein n=1 Tax=Phellinidium pouzarii TaxID=167371 RepID=A0A4S4KZJ2_9AGAM|nr:hypothetical protein EW145_g5753 [Phellinidium pouzarii]
MSAGLQRFRGLNLLFEVLMADAMSHVDSAAVPAGDAAETVGAAGAGAVDAAGVGAAACANADFAAAVSTVSVVGEERAMNEASGPDAELELEIVLIFDHQGSTLSQKGNPMLSQAAKLAVAAAARIADADSELNADADAVACHPYQHCEAQAHARARAAASAKQTSAKSSTLLC